MGFAGTRKMAVVLLAAGLWSGLAAAALAADTSEGTPVDIRLGNGLRIVSVKPGTRSAPVFRPAQALSSPQNASLSGTQSAATTFVRPPLFGFSPKVAVTLTDKKKHSFDQDMAHVLATAAGGNMGNPLNPPAEDNFVIGILDSGANSHVIAEPYSSLLGLSGPYMTSNPFEASGVGGTLEGLLSYPIGVFAAGLDAVQSTGQLDVSRVVGHYNVSVFATPEINCGQGEVVTALVGVPLMTFYKSIIRVSQPREVVVGGVAYGSPDVQLLTSVPPATLSQFPRGIALTYASDLPLPPLTAAYNYSLLDEIDFDTPSVPTVLAYDWWMQSGGLYAANIGLLEGEPGPLNPVQFYSNFLMDTGAQASIITEATAASLNLDLMNPDFTVAVCGIGGLSSLPGFYIDYVKMNASGGALEFEHAPFIVLNLPSLGGPLQGIIGMNFFWNRDVLFDVTATPTTLSAFFRVSNPMPMAYGDFDQDLDVDAKDLTAFVTCVSGPATAQLDPACTWFDADEDQDVDQSDFGVFQACLSGRGVRANVNCGPPW